MKYSALAQVLIFALVSLSFIACTTTTEKADELFEAGLYHDAVNMYRKAIDEDPDDHEAKIGLAKAQQELVSKGLIEVRMLRMSGSFRIAAEKLNAILEKEKKWNVKYNAGVSQTQEREVGEISRWLDREIKKSAAENRPDEARWYSKRFSKVMQAASLRIDADSQEKMEEAATKNCTNLQTQVDSKSHFYLDFVQTYCRSWGINWSYQLEPKDNSRFQGIGIQDSIEVSENPRQGITTQGLKSKLETVFRSSPWYSPSASATMDMNLGGRIVFKRRSNPSFRTAKYYLSVKEKKDKKKTRRVQKTYRYPVMEYNEELNLDLSLQLQLDGKPSQLSHSKKLKHRTESTKASFAKAKVRPKSADFMNITAKLENNFSDLSQTLHRSLHQLWVARYCQGVWRDFSRTESLFRCYRVKADHTPVVAWFKSHFHLSPSDYLISIR